MSSTNGTERSSRRRAVRTARIETSAEVERPRRRSADSVADRRSADSVSQRRSANPVVERRSANPIVERRSAAGIEEQAKLFARPGREDGKHVSSFAAGAMEGLDKPKVILILLRELRAVIEEENGCLRARRTSELSGLLSRKQSLSRGYLEQMAAVKTDPEMLQALPAERRAELREAGEALSTAMAENALLLQANIDVVRSLVGIIVQAVKDQRSESSPAYAESGLMDEEQGDPKARAIALNREF